MRTLVHTLLSEECSNIYLLRVERPRPFSSPNPRLGNLTKHYNTVIICILHDTNPRLRHIMSYFHLASLFIFWRVLEGFGFAHTLNRRVCPFFSHFRSQKSNNVSNLCLCEPAVQHLGFTYSNNLIFNEIHGRCISVTKGKRKGNIFVIQQGTFFLFSFIYIFILCSGVFVPSFILFIVCFLQSSSLRRGYACLFCFLN